MQFQASVDRARNKNPLLTLIFSAWAAKDLSKSSCFRINASTPSRESPRLSSARNACVVMVDLFRTRKGICSSNEFTKDHRLLYENPCCRSEHAVFNIRKILCSVTHFCCWYVKIISLQTQLSLHKVFFLS